MGVVAANRRTHSLEVEPQRCSFLEEQLAKLAPVSVSRVPLPNLVFGKIDEGANPYLVTLALMLVEIISTRLTSVSEMLTHNKQGLNMFKFLLLNNTKIKT